jgi:protein phosphatase 1 regulatory subunit 21
VALDVRLYFVEILYNAETIGALEQEKEHWRLEYQLLKIKCEKMRDDHSKDMESLREHSQSNVTIDEQLDQIASSTSTNDKRLRARRATSDPPSERETTIKQYYSQKILDLETKLQLANGKGIAFYNEVLPW